MFFQHLVEEKPDPVFGLVEAFKTDSRASKINLIAGIYLDEHLQAHLMESAKKALKKTSSQNFTADYLPIDGFFDFHSRIGELAFGEALWQNHRERVYSAQALGGTGALQVAGQLLFQKITKKIAISSPTWANHIGIFKRAGFEIVSYPYHSEKSQGLDLETVLSHLSQLEEKTAVLLHTVCHNPTGSDPTEEQWREISQIIKEKKLFPLFDFAYQGFGQGVEKDRHALEIFFQDGHEMLVAYSCSKNFSLCRQRVGALLAVSENPEAKRNVSSQIKSIIRSLYSNPPGFGAAIAAEILKDAALKKQWEIELSHMRHRLETMRKGLVEKLASHTKGVRFRFLAEQKGMFAFTGLTKPQAERLRQEFGVYILDTGRLSLPGLNEQNLEAAANAILSVL